MFELIDELLAIVPEYEDEREDVPAPEYPGDEPAPEYPEVDERFDEVPHGYYGNWDYVSPMDGMEVDHDGYMRASPVPSEHASVSSSFYEASTVLGDWHHLEEASVSSVEDVSLAEDVSSVDGSFSDEDVSPAGNVISCPVVSSSDGVSSMEDVEDVPSAEGVISCPTVSSSDDVSCKNLED